MTPITRYQQQTRKLCYH